MRDQDPGDRFAAIARQLQDLPSHQSVLDRIASVAVDVVAGCDHAGITMVQRREVLTVAATDEVVRAGDRKQYELGEGPCLDALHREEIVTSPHLASDRRWPRWSPWVRDQLGVGSMLCVRLFTTGDQLGGLNLYAGRPDGFDQHDEAVAVALAAHAAVALAAAHQIDHLNIAVVNRTVIGQAEGILMERFDISAEQAFGVLSRVSQQENRRLIVIAEELVRSRRTPGT